MPGTDMRDRRQQERVGSPLAFLGRVYARVLERTAHGRAGGRRNREVSVEGSWRMRTPCPTSGPRYAVRRSRRKVIMKAIVVTDQAAGTAGMKLTERPKPQAAINDVIVRIHASGFVPTELEWPSTW